jgi:hypothetical protein
VGAGRKEAQKEIVKSTGAWHFTLGERKERYRDLYEAAGAADATACSRIGSGGGFEISWVTEKGGPVTQLRKKMLEELRRRNADTY